MSEITNVRKVPNGRGHLLEGADGTPYVETMAPPGPLNMFGREITSMTVVVLDRDAYDRLLDELAGRPPGSTITDWPAQVEKLRELGQIPMIGRGTMTEWLFERFLVDREQKVLSVCHRGFGQKVINQLANEAARRVNHAQYN